MNKKGFSQIIILAFVVFLVAGYFTLTKSPLTPEDGVVNWQTYRNENLGFEFKYPTQINGKPVSVVERENLKDFLLFQSEIPYGPPIKRKGELVQPHFSHQITFSAKKFSDFVYPAPQGQIYAPTLKVGVSIGGLSGYIYDPSKNLWHSLVNLQEELTWEEMYKYFSSYLPEDFPIIKTTSGHNAFPYSGSAYENYWDGYRVFNTDDGLYLNFNHDDGYAPEIVKAEAEKEDKAIREFLQNVVATVTFF